MMSAAASLGLVLLWNVEEGLTQIDKFLYSNDDHIKAGAALAGTLGTSYMRMHMHTHIYTYTHQHL